MSAKHAVIGGLMGALVMTLAAGIARVFLIPVDLELLLGSLFTGQVGLGTWFLGLGLHLAIGALLAVVYAFILEAWFHRSSWALGVALAVPHAAIAGLCLGVLPEVHPLVPLVLPPPGLFMVNLGPVAVAGFIAVHLIYGGIVGGMCSRREPSAEARRGASRLRDLQA